MSAAQLCRHHLAATAAAAAAAAAGGGRVGGSAGGGGGGLRAGGGEEEEVGGDTELLAAGLDLLSGCCEGLEGSVESLVADSGDCVQLALAATRSGSADVRQSAFALIGDLARMAPAHARPQAR